MNLLNTNRWNAIRYSLYAPFYDGAGRLFNAYRTKSIGYLQIQPGDRVLLLGAGTGLDLEWIPSEADITAVDISPAMVRRIRKRAQALRKKVRVHVMDGQNLEFADESFDHVVLHLIVAVIPDPHRCMKEAERVLKKGGKAVIMDKFLQDNRKPGPGRKMLNAFTSFLFSDINRKVSDIVGGSGLTVEKTEDAGWGGVYKIVVLTKSYLKGTRP